MVIAGIVIVVATFIAVIKQFETRLVLLLSGLLMCFIGGQLSAWYDGLCERTYKSRNLYRHICTVLVLVMLWSIQNVQSTWYISFLQALKR